VKLPIQRPTNSVKRFKSIESKDRSISEKGRLNEIPLAFSE